MTIIVALSWPEVLLAANAGIMRRVSALRRGRADLYPDASRPMWDRDINGALAEVAVAKWMGVFWSGTVGRVDLPDVGNLQVRSKTQDGDRLVVRPDDDDADIFVSVLVQPPQYRLCGWLYGREAKREEWVVSHGCYFVRDEFLHPMASLPDERQRRACIERLLEEIPL